MPKNLQENNKLLVVSDTGMYIDKGKVFAFGPVVKEMEYLLYEFDSIVWIGFNRLDQFDNPSYLAVENSKIEVLMLKKIGGINLIDKLGIIIAYPKMFFIILNQVFNFQKIHTRAPSNPAFITMLISFFFPQKKFWHKYAGNWIEIAPFFYKVQRSLLKKLGKNNVITINGNYEKKRNIISFENPCLDNEDRILGMKIIKSKELSKKRSFCFVGALNTNKGVDKILEAFTLIRNYKEIDTIHFVGDGPRKNEFEKAAKKLGVLVVFHGFLPKNQIISIYIKSHFIILPSKSEGFPKVIGEAMNYGCVPIVSDISCISDYVKDNINGFLIHPINTKTLTNKILEALSLNKIRYKTWIDVNYHIAEKFTYSYYNQRIITEIFN